MGWLQVRVLLDLETPIKRLVLKNDRYFSHKHILNTAVYKATLDIPQGGPVYMSRYFYFSMVLKSQKHCFFSWNSHNVHSQLHSAGKCLKFLFSNALIPGGSRRSW